MLYMQKRKRKHGSQVKKKKNISSGNEKGKILYVGKHLHQCCADDEPNQQQQHQYKTLVEKLVQLEPIGELQFQEQF